MIATRTRDLADDLRVARIHLRMGQLALARAELEDLLGRDALDTVGLAVLAEARWRTGETESAAQAAEAHLEAGGVDAVAVCIAAESAALEGRQRDASVLMNRLPNADAATLDVLFAGMPRRAYWPAGPVDQGELEEIRRETDAHRGASRPDRGGRPAFLDAPTEVYRRELFPEAPRADTLSAGHPAAASDRPSNALGRAVPGPREVLDASSDWAELQAQAAASAAAGPEGASRPARPGTRHAKVQLEPLAELDAARRELESTPERAFLRLALALRADPTLAPAVLKVLYRRHEPLAELVRGDAERLLGRHLEAEAAFDVAAESLEP